MKNQYTATQKKWLNALESGEYDQCTDYLRDGNSFCCLGVAVHLIDPEHLSIELDDDNVSYGHLDGDQDAPDDIVKAMMFKTRQGGTFANDASLSAKNDEGKTFGEISAFVRENPHLVFTNFEDTTS